MLPRRIRTDDRVLVVAQTGGGKTVAVRHATRHVSSVIAIDSKRDLTLPDAEITEDAGDLWRPGRWVWRPPLLTDGVDAAEEVCRIVLQRRETLLIVDEAGLVSSPARIGPAMRAVVVAGRSMGIGMWVCTQSSVGVSNPLLMRQAQHTLVGSITGPMAGDLRAPSMGLPNELIDRAIQIPPRVGTMLMVSAGYMEWHELPPAPLG